MKKSNLENAQKLNREAKKAIVGQGQQLCPPTGCFYYYLSDSSGRCIIPPCNSDYGSEMRIDERWQCCF